MYLPDNNSHSFILWVLQNGASQSTVEDSRCSSVNSLEKVLDQFGRLLRGKLEYLASDLKDSMCAGDQRTFNGRWCWLNKGI